MKDSHLITWDVVLEDFMSVKDFLQQRKGMSTRTLKALKKEGKLLCNGREVTVRHVLRGGDRLQVLLPPAAFPASLPLCDLPLNILFEDDYLLLVNKPPYIPMFPGRGEEKITLAGAVLNYYKQHEISASCHAVSRLDRQTSGVVTFAKQGYAHQRLADLFHEGKGRKVYAGVTKGRWQSPQGIINAPIARQQGSLVEHVVHPKGKHARTGYKVLEEKGEHSLVEFRLFTGRTHQIRVHSSYMGHPLVGDTLYGDPSLEINRQALHAKFLYFCHPVEETWHAVEAELPEDMKILM